MDHFYSVANSLFCWPSGQRRTRRCATPRADEKCSGQPLDLAPWPDRVPVRSGVLDAALPFRPGAQDSLRHRKTGVLLRNRRPRRRDSTNGSPASNTTHSSIRKASIASQVPRSTLSAPVIFALLTTTTTLNPICAAVLSLARGGLCACYCRPDLVPKMLLAAPTSSSPCTSFILTLAGGISELRSRGLEPSGDIRRARSRHSRGGTALRVQRRVPLVGVYEHLKWQRVSLVQEHRTVSVGT